MKKKWIEKIPSLFDMTMFKTTSGAPFHFNFDNSDLANTVFIGKSGTGMSAMSKFTHSLYKGN